MAPGPMDEQKCMVQENHTAAELGGEALRRVVSYLWDDELTSYTEAWYDGPGRRDGHVFRDVYRLAKVAYGATVLGVSGPLGAGKRYALVRVNGLVVVEEDGELDCTDWDGDDFRESVGIVFGAMAELALALED